MSIRKRMELMEQLAEAIGGEWKITEADAPVQGYSATFPKFRSDAIVGVINDAAMRVRLEEQAVAFRSGAGSMLADTAPDAPFEVVIPRELAENDAFRDRLDEGMKDIITQVVSQRLSYAASTQGWMHR